jgi:hypothetical protein
LTAANEQPFELSLSHNNFTEIPDLTKLSNLTLLNMSHNKFYTLNNSSSLMLVASAIKTLDFSSNEIFMIESEFFAPFTNLVTLKLNHNKLRRMAHPFHFTSMRLKLISINSNILNNIDIYFNDTTSTNSHSHDNKAVIDVVDFSRNKFYELPIIRGHVKSIGLLNLSSSNMAMMQSNSFDLISSKIPAKIGHLDLSNNSLYGVNGKLNIHFFDSIDLSNNEYDLGVLCNLFGHDVTDRSSRNNNNNENAAKSIEVTFFPQKMSESAALKTCDNLKKSRYGFKSGNLVIPGNLGPHVKLVVLKDCDYVFDPNKTISKIPCNKPNMFFNE